MIPPHRANTVSTFEYVILLVGNNTKDWNIPTDQNAVAAVECSTSEPNAERLESTREFARQV
ncbi:MAG: hypothetical protein J07HQX50_02188 [Haloquadratum sp. J07HQX50]|nr:MAG: hypothetical protein J07HQX50_02188 [Haloquadratum sp. J07HQX50]